MCGPGAAILATGRKGVNNAARQHPDLRRRALCMARRTPYTCLMQFVLPVIVVLAMLATLGVLFLGIFSMARGDNPRRSNKLMQMRVLLQGLALLLFAIFMLLYRR